MSASEGSPTKAEREARRVCSNRLRLLICTTCWKRPLSCSCEGTKQTADKQHVTNAGWRSIDVFSREQVVAALRAAEVDVEPVLAILDAEPPERRRVERRPYLNTNGASGRQLA